MQRYRQIVTRGQRQQPIQACTTAGRALGGVGLALERVPRQPNLAETHNASVMLGELLLHFLELTVVEALLVGVEPETRPYRLRRGRGEREVARVGLGVATDGDH